MLTASLADSYLEGIRAFNVAFTATLGCTVFSVKPRHYPPYFTFTMFFIPAARNTIKSSSIEQLEISPATNQALVTYKGGNQYLYSNIDEDAMFDVIFYNVKSFGKWVNDNCKTAGVACFPIAA